MSERILNGEKAVFASLSVSHSCKAVVVAIDCLSGGGSSFPAISTASGGGGVVKSPTLSLVSLSFPLRREAWPYCEFTILKALTFLRSSGEAADQLRSTIGHTDDQKNLLQQPIEHGEPILLALAASVPLLFLKASSPSADISLEPLPEECSDIENCGSFLWAFEPSDEEALEPRRRPVEFGTSKVMCQSFKGSNSMAAENHNNANKPTERSRSQRYSASCVMSVLHRDELYRIQTEDSSRRELSEGAMGSCEGKNEQFGCGALAVRGMISNATVAELEVRAVSDGVALSLPDLIPQQRHLWTLLKPSRPISPPWSIPLPTLPFTDLMPVHYDNLPSDAIPPSQSSDKAMPCLSSMGFIPESVQEQILIEDLLFCFLGVDGAFVRIVNLPSLESQNGQHVDPTDAESGVEFYEDRQRSLSCQIHTRLNEHTRLDEPLEKMTRKIAGVCLLQKTVCQFVEQHSQVHYGLVSGAVCEAIRGLLREFDLRVSKLEAHARTPNAPPLTLQSLWFYLQPARATFEILVEICHSVRGRRGGILLNGIDEILSRRNSAPNARSLCQHLFECGLVPLRNLLQIWTTEGRVEDAHGDFFIETGSTFPLFTGDESGASSASHFFLNVANVPNFLRPWSEKILQTGKYLNILQSCGARSSYTAGKEHDSQRPTSHGGEDANHSNLKNSLDDAYRCASRSLVALLFTQLQLKECFEFLSKFFFFRRADCFLQFLEIADLQELEKPQPVLTKLDACWEACVRNCGAAGASESYKEELSFGVSSLSLQELSRWFDDTCGGNKPTPSCPPLLHEMGVTPHGHASSIGNIRSAPHHSSPHSSPPSQGSTEPLIDSSSLAAATCLPLQFVSAAASKSTTGNTRNPTTSRHIQHWPGPLLSRMWNSTADTSGTDDLRNGGIMRNAFTDHASSRWGIFGTSAGTKEESLSHLTLVYKPQWPLTLIFTPTAILKYQMIFRLLIHFKCLEKLLSEVWQAHTFTKQIKKGFALSHFTVQKMSFFCRSFVYYVTLEVLEPETQNFFAALARTSSTLETITELHNAHLTKCIQRTLLADAGLLRNLMKVSSICYLFARHALKFTHYGRSAPRFTTAHDMDGKGGLGIDKSLDLGHSTSEVPNALTSRRIRQREVAEHFSRLGSDSKYHRMVQQYARHFDKNIQIFLKELSTKSRTRYDHYLSNLVSRLDYNHFYTKHFEHTFPSDGVGGAADVSSAAPSSIGGGVSSFFNHHRAAAAGAESVTSTKISAG